MILLRDDYFLQPSFQLEKFQNVNDALLDCIQACNACISISLLPEEDTKRLALVVKTCRDCADLCILTSQFIIRNSQFARKEIELCIEACRVCAEECEKFDLLYCLECARACRLCSSECRRLVM